MTIQEKMKGGTVSQHEQRRHKVLLPLVTATTDCDLLELSSQTRKTAMIKVSRKNFRFDRGTIMDHDTTQQQWWCVVVAALVQGWLSTTRFKRNGDGIFRQHVDQASIDGGGVFVLGKQETDG